MTFADLVSQFGLASDSTIKFNEWAENHYTYWEVDGHGYSVWDETPEQTRILAALASLEWSAHLPYFNTDEMESISPDELEKARSIHAASKAYSDLFMELSKQPTKEAGEHD